MTFVINVSVLNMLYCNFVVKISMKHLVRDLNDTEVIGLGRRED